MAYTIGLAYLALYILNKIKTALSLAAMIVVVVAAVVIVVIYERDKKDC